MDAALLLKKQGWRGLGHSLDTNNKGLRKPLLVTKKIDVLGIGINKTDVIQGQWWLKAFDSSLKDFGTGKKSILANVKEQGIKRGGLYGRFVQGEGVPGTIGVKEVGDVRAVGGVKRKAEDDDEEDEDEDSTERKKAKKEKKRSKPTSSSSSDDDNDDKKTRRAAKKAKKLAPNEATTDATTEPSKTKSKSETKTKTKTKSKKDKSLQSLPEDKRKQYEQRAAAKGVTLETYFSQRQVKNLEAKESRRGGSDTPVAELVSASASEDSSKDEKKEKEKKEKEKKKKEKKSKKDKKAEK